MNTSQNLRAKVLYFFARELLPSKIHEIFTDVCHDKNKLHGFFRFFKSLVPLKNAKNRINIIYDYLSNIKNTGLKV